MEVLFSLLSQPDISEFLTSRLRGALHTDSGGNGSRPPTAGAAGGVERVQEQGMDRVGQRAGRTAAPGIGPRRLPDGAVRRRSKMDSGRSAVNPRYGTT